MTDNSFFDMFKAMGKGMKVPGVDVDAILDYHRKNLEALEATAKMASAGATTVFDRQREMLADTLKQWTEIAQAAKSGNPQDVMAKQADLAKKSFEAAVKNASETADMMTRSGSAAFDLLKQRITEAMDETRKAVEKVSKV
jgi:phasin family protein